VSSQKHSGQQRTPTRNVALCEQAGMEVLLRRFSETFNYLE